MKEKERNGRRMEGREEYWMVENGSHGRKMKKMGSSGMRLKEIRSSEGRIRVKM